MRLLYALKYNQTLVKLQAENNRVRVCRRLLGLIGDLVIYHNRSLRVLILTTHANLLTHLSGDNETSPQKHGGSTEAIFGKPEPPKDAKPGLEQAVGQGFGCTERNDLEMLEDFKKLILENSLLKLLVI